MAELVFPITATLFLVLIAIPAATVVSKLVLVALRRAQHGAARLSEPGTAGVRQAGSSARYTLLVAPVGVPALWLASAAVHHAEAEEAAIACLFDHMSEGCTEPLMISAAVGLGLAAVFLWRRHIATRGLSTAPHVHDPLAERAVASACATHPRLVALARRIRIVEGAGMRTIGLFRPRIEVGAAVARALDGQALMGALLHEEEHVRGFDPLRFLVAAVCQSVNPAAFLLGDELARWRAGRETVCDEAAVHRGADPCSLAEALIAVARPPEARGRAAHLSRGGGIELLRVRVTLLMDYATAPPRCHCARTAPKVAALAVVVLALLPHYFGQRVIVDLHQGAERVAFDALEMR